MKSDGNPQSVSNNTTELSDLKPSFVSRLFQPVDISVLVFFRVSIGLLLLHLMWHFVFFTKKVNGETVRVDFVKLCYIDTPFNLTYPGFDWVSCPPGDFIYWLFGFLALFSICITLGLFYRISCFLFSLGFTFVFLLERARYLNHYYLLCLIPLLLAFIPAHRAFSLDALMSPKIKSQSAPAWTLWLLRFQIGCVYFFAGIAKLDVDWLNGTTFALLTETAPPLDDERVILLMSWAGMLFDLFIVPLLMWRKTRILAFAAVLMFNITNSQMFKIDIFPWFMISASLLYFEPDWPRRIINKLFNRPATKATEQSPPITRLTSSQNFTVLVLAIFVAIQVLLPFRHHLYEGETNWTDNGHIFAWRMMLRMKLPGHARFFFQAKKDGQIIRGEIPIVDKPVEILKSWQLRTILVNPDMILQFAHILAADLREKGFEDVEIYTKIPVSLNDSKLQLLIDPSVDLAKEERRIFTAYPWVTEWKRIPSNLK